MVTAMGGCDVAHVLLKLLQPNGASHDSGIVPGYQILLHSLVAVRLIVKSPSSDYPAERNGILYFLKP